MEYLKHWLDPSPPCRKCLLPTFSSHSHIWKKCGCSPQIRPKPWAIGRGDDKKPCRLSERLGDTDLSPEPFNLLLVYIKKTNINLQSLSQGSWNHYFILWSSNWPSDRETWIDHIHTDSVMQGHCKRRSSEGSAEKWLWRKIYKQEAEISKSNVSET